MHGFWISSLKAKSKGWPTAFSPFIWTRRHWPTPDGSLNFKGVSVDFRAGTQDQEHISGFPAVENEIGVGVELTSKQPWIHAINNLQLSAVRVRLSADGLSKANTSNGDINGYRVEYAIDISTDQGSFVEVLKTAFDGKTTSKYERTHRIELPKASSGWSVRGTAPDGQR